MKSHTLTDLDAQLRFHDFPGLGIPLVFVHGLGCSSSCDYPRVVSDPALARRRFILVDLLGSGFSDRPDSFLYSMEDHARSLVDLLNALDAPEAHFFGHSMGGTIAIVVASLQPDRIRRLVLAEPNLDAGGGVFSRAIAAQSESDYITHGHAETIRSATANGNHIWAGSMAVSSPAAIHREATSLVRGGAPSWRDQLSSLRIPRTIIFGERSLPNPDATGLAKVGISIISVPNAGHSLMWENPSGLASAIDAALT
ncbi:MAG: alpha/beta hydrolase [Chthoniobacterales bacterium]|nr:alpha/beta hydrolase [Chthoniobacterales bacterium]